jgi:predicted transcriptional regulator
MVLVNTTTSLKLYRTGLSPKVSQESLARKAEIVLQTYRNAEAGCNCSYSTARAILKALNTERQTRGLEAVSLDQLGLSIV